ncbi:MAG: hypothetical protein LBG89_01470 [Rickettsiales bacterium]|jgi:hypothetical protein|nr:hypothetical protein [Rickettsiales bacterium]
MWNTKETGVAVSLSNRIFSECFHATSSLAREKELPGLCFINIYDDRGYRYYEASDRYILIRKREEIPEGEDELSEPIRILPQKKYIYRSNELIGRFVPDPDDIIKIDYPSFDGIIPRNGSIFDKDAAKPWISKKNFNVITHFWKLDISKFWLQAGEGDNGFLGGLIYYKDDDIQVCCMLQLPMKTIEVPVLDKVEKVSDGNKFTMAGLEFEMDARSVLSTPDEILAAIKKLMLEKGFEEDDVHGLNEVLKELGLTLRGPGAKPGKYIPPSSSFEEFRDNVDADRKMLSQYMLADNLKISYGPSKTRISSLAEVFTELYISLKCDSLESFMKKTGGLFSAAQLESIMRGRAYISPAAFKYIRLMADFHITPKKLSKLNLDVIKSEKAARCVDVDMKLLGELTRKAAKMRAHIRREKRRVYNLERRETNRRSGKYENIYGDKTSVTPSMRESIDKSRAKRNAKNELGKKICPAVRMFMDLKKSLSYTTEKTFNDLVTIGRNRYMRIWLDKESDEEHYDLEGEFRYKQVSWKMKRVYVKYKRTHSSEAAAIHCDFPNHGRKPLKVKTTCPALQNADYTLCPFYKNAGYIYNKEYEKCEMESFLQRFRGEAEEVLQHYIDKIKAEHEQKSL